MLKICLVGMFVMALLGEATSALADLICPFEGQLDITQKKFNVTLELGEESSVSLEGSTLAQDNYHFLLSVNHLDTPVFDLSTELETSLGVLNRDNISQRTWQGQVSSRYSLLNFKPVEELSGFFEMKNNTLHLQSVSLGGLTLNGSLELFSPYKVDLFFDLKEIKMDDFLAFWGAQGELDSRGFVSGQILVSGFLNQLGLKGNLAAYNGVVHKFQYDSIILNLEGVYPIVNLSNSSVAQSDGLTFKLEGSFDLTNRKHFPQEVAALRKLPMVSQDNSTMEWTVKKEVSPDSKTTEYKYFIRKENANGTAPKEEPNMLGVERSIKF